MIETTGYSGTPLIKKLGIKSGMKCLFLNTPGHFHELLGPLPTDSKTDYILKNETYDFIIAFIHSKMELENDWHNWKESLMKTGSLWIAHPKGSSKLPKDLNQNDIRNFGLENGLVDTKVCAIDADWSGLKFMFMKTDR